jgi:hypothetical protein
MNTVLCKLRGLPSLPGVDEGVGMLRSKSLPMRWPVMTDGGA